MADANEWQYVDTLQQLPQMTLTSNQNPLKKLELIDKPLTIKQDQESKQVINTIRETPPEMYTPPHLLIASQDKLSLFRKHIPKQKEIDTLLKDLRKRVLHNLMVNLDMKDLIEHYSKSLRYRDIYNYIADSRLPGNVNTQKKIAGKATNYVIVNGLLYKIVQHKESGKWIHYVLLVIPREIRVKHLKHVSQQSISYASRPVQNISDDKKAILFSKHASQNTEIYRSMYPMSKN